MENCDIDSFRLSNEVSEKRFFFDFIERDKCLRSVVENIIFAQK